MKYRNTKTVIDGVTFDTARRTNDGWRWGDDSRVSSGWTIVAWMPLPEVYKESK